MSARCAALVALLWLALVSLTAQASGISSNVAATAPSPCYASDAGDCIGLAGVEGYYQARALEQCSYANTATYCSLSGTQTTFNATSVTLKISVTVLPPACLPAGDPSCKSGYTYGGFPQNGTIPVACPDNSTGSGGSCSCAAGFGSIDGTSCVPSAQACSGLAAQIPSSSTFAWVGGGLTACIQGCTMSFPFTGISSGVTYGSEPAATGSTCDPSGSTPGAPSTTESTAPLASGQCPGQVNGVTVSVPCSSTTQQGPTTSTTGAGGAPGTTTTSTTSCSGGQCTTTTTTRDSSGAVQGSTQTTESQGGFCAANPSYFGCPSASQAAQAASGAASTPQSSYSGGCGAAPACSGDAIECAIAAQTLAAECAVSGSGPEAGVTQAAVTAGTSGGLAGVSESTVDLATAIDTADTLGGSCPGDIQAGSVVIHFGDACPALQALGSLLVGVSMLWAAFIIFGR